MFLIMFLNYKNNMLNAGKILETKTHGGGDYSFIYCFYYIPGYFFPYLIFVFNTAVPWVREYYSYFSAEDIRQEWLSNQTKFALLVQGESELEFFVNEEP